LTKPKSKPAPKRISKAAAQHAATVPQAAKPNQVLCPPPPELDKSIPNLKHLGGSQSDDWNLLIANQVMNAEWYGSEPTPEEKAKQRTAVLAFLVGVKPQATIEGMMAAQLFASHTAAMECYRRAALPGQTDYGREMNLTHAAKLTRANAAQVEALAKHRNKGQQKVIVEHVHVYQGGQAAFIANAPPGEGVGKIGEGQPHVLTAAQRPALPCSDPQGHALPIAGNAERSLQNARGTLAGSA
jgi:hypothetical protein